MDFSNLEIPRGSASTSVSTKMALSAPRARAVLSYMIDRLGADPNRFTIVSFGEERPAQMGKSEESWSLNRRVEFTSL